MEILRKDSEKEDIISIDKSDFDNLWKNTILDDNTVFVLEYPELRSHPHFAKHFINGGLFSEAVCYNKSLPTEALEFILNTKKYEFVEFSIVNNRIFCEGSNIGKYVYAILNKI